MKVLEKDSYQIWIKVAETGELINFVVPGPHQVEKNLLKYVELFLFL